MSVPDQLTLARHRDLRGRAQRPYVRWAVLTALGLLCVLGLLNVFGQRQRPATSTVAADGVELQAATLLLDHGWL